MSGKRAAHAASWTSAGRRLWPSFIPVLHLIRSDNGPEFAAQAVQDWLNAVGAKTVSIEPGSRWVNGYRESFDAGFRDELLNGEIYYSRFGLSQRSKMLVTECHQSIEDGVISINEAKRPLREAIAPKQVLLDMKLHLEQEST